MWFGLALLLYAPLAGTIVGYGGGWLQPKIASRMGWDLDMAWWPAFIITFYAMLLPVGLLAWWLL